MLDNNLLEDTEGDDGGKDDADDPPVYDGGDQWDGSKLPVIAEGGWT